MSFGYNPFTNNLDKSVSGNEIGDVTGPSSAIQDDIATFADNTGKVIKDSSFKISDLLAVVNNLSDLENITSARENLGLKIGVDVQAWNAQLDALAALLVNGMIARTSANVFTSRTFQAGSNKVSIINPDGVNGDPSFDVIPDNFFPLLQWFPTVMGSTIEGSVTYGIQAGRFINICNLLWIAVGQILWSNGNGSGNLRVGGFPAQFAQGLTVYSAHCSFANILLPDEAVGITLDGQNAQTYANLMANINNAGQAPVPYSAMGSLGFTMVWFS
jgi:hypothetical protein